MNFNTDAKTNRLRNKNFYIRCPDNEKYFRNIYIMYNPFSNSLQPKISNPVYGEPPDGLEPLPPSIIGYLFRVNMSNNPLEDY
jgi:hypothetical protein